MSTPTPSRGIGRGGLRNPPGGRPKGAINKRTRAVIEEAERTGQMLPLDRLLGVMRDPQAEPKARDAAAVACLPYCHARLWWRLPTMLNPDVLDDAALTSSLAQLERHVAQNPDSVELIVARVEGVIDSDIPQLPIRSQQVLFRRLIQAAEAGLERLNDPNRPGRVAPRYTVQPGPNGTAQQAPEAPPPTNKHFRYNSDTGEMEPIS